MKKGLGANAQTINYTTCLFRKQVLTFENFCFHQKSQKANQINEME